MQCTGAEMFRSSEEVSVMGMEQREHHHSADT